MPKFSVIFTAHDSAAYMRRGLESIRRQVCKDYELIVVCDACSDDSAKVAAEYADTVIVVDYRNPGPARNAGLEASRGEWILFMDDDDWWLHEYVLTQLDGHLGDEDILAFGFIWKGRGYTSPNRPGGWLWPAPWSKALRRTAIGQTRFPEEYPDDLIFMQRMMMKAPAIRYWEMPMYYYNYWREGSISCQKERDLRTDVYE